MKSIHQGLTAIAIASLASCSSLPLPGDPANTAIADAPDAASLVEASAKQSGDAWRNGHVVDVRFDGKWSPIATRLQPDLTDPGYRKTSHETYVPRESRVTQRHRGPAGTKRVERTPQSIEIKYAPKREVTELQKAAAALVTDAYPLFLFRSSWLADRGRDFKVIGKRDLGGESCWLVEATVVPGFGGSRRDHVVAWIGRRSLRTHRVQLTLFGLESTAMADVDVTFDEFQAADRDTEWPGHFVEFIQRPFKAQAHEWWLHDIRVR